MRAPVIKRDTIEIYGARIRLHNIDAPESHQLCTHQGGKYRCGQRIALAPSNRIGCAVVTCDSTEVHRFGRLMAICHTQREKLNGWMVAGDWAMAHRGYRSAIYSVCRPAMYQHEAGLYQQIPPAEHVCWGALDYDDL